MAITSQPLFALDDSYARELPGLYEPWQPKSVPQPHLLALNEGLAAELGLDPESLRADAGVAVLAGNAVPEGANPIAQAYAGHQFGGYSPRLGDGRALLLGELTDTRGRRRDLHLKGSGATPFARRGDGKAVVGPMLREYVIGEAMHALGIPTTRALAVVATGEAIARETLQPGAVLTRVAASHLRVGTFQYAAATGDRELLRRLADYAIARHHPRCAEADRPALALFDAVLEAQASLIAQWMLAGFVHGVMNTDNMTISGESIDYGPCAFMDVFDPATVYSSIDHGGRYAYGNQPQIAQWNLARLAEALLPLIDDDTESAVVLATEILHTFPGRFGEHFRRGMAAKLGLAEPDDALFNDLLRLLHEHERDHTRFFRELSAGVGLPGAFDGWVARWRALDPDIAAMDRVNPVYIPRNHIVEDALMFATAGDLERFERLVDAVSSPFDERPGLEAYASPAPADFDEHYRTFCGT